MDISEEYRAELDLHYARTWGRPGTLSKWKKGPALPQTCYILEYQPWDDAGYWVYASCGMTQHQEPDLLEIFILSPVQTEAHIELLTAIAHYHQTAVRLRLGDTVDFGRPWLPGSHCAFGLISLPYPFGPKLENASILGKTVGVLWLLPITAEERSFKATSGLDALEELFEAQGVDCLDQFRTSVVKHGN